MDDLQYVEAEEIEIEDIRFNNTITAIDGEITYEEGDLYFRDIGIYVIDNILAITITLRIEPDDSKTAPTFQGTSYDMEFKNHVNEIQQMTKNDFCNTLYTEILNSTDESGYLYGDNEHNWKEFIDIIREYQYSVNNTPNPIITHTNIDDETNVPLNTILLELAHQITNFIDNTHYINFKDEEEDEHPTKSALFGIQNGGSNKYKYMKYKTKYLQLKYNFID
jgi:hypothetical protein